MIAEEPRRAFVLLRHAHDFDKVEGVDESDLWQHDCLDANEDDAAICDENNKWIYNFGSM